MGELQVQWETLSQKTRCKVIEKDTWSQSLASTCSHTHTCTHSYITSTQTSNKEITAGNSMIFLRNQWGLWIIMKKNQYHSINIKFESFCPFYVKWKIQYTLLSQFLSCTSRFLSCPQSSEMSFGSVAIPPSMFPVLSDLWSSAGLVLRWEKCLFGDILKNICSENSYSYNIWAQFP